MNYEDIIKSSIEKLNQDIEYRNSLYLNIIYKNIDVLADKAPSWFGDDIPDEFREVINSLVNLSVLFADKARKSTQMYVERSFEQFEVCPVFHEIKEHFLNMIRLDAIEIDGDCSNEIITSKSIFRDAIYHLFFCVSQFATNNSYCTVTIENDFSSVKITMSFFELEDALPDVRTMLRLFFLYGQPRPGEKGDLGLKVGLNVAVENIKRIGGIIHIDTKTSKSDLAVTISFPSKEFLDTINDVRKYEFLPKNSKNQGVLIFSFKDKVAEVLLAESLKDYGYTIVSQKINKIVSGNDFEEAKSLVVDIDNILSNFKSLPDFAKYINGKQVIIIHKQTDNLPYIENFRYLEIPFEIEKVLDNL